MTVFVDTSALYAFLVETEEHHRRVVGAMTDVLRDGRALTTTSYVLVESVALLQHRIGLAPVRDLQQKVVPLLDVTWVSPRLHQRAMRRLCQSDRRHLSLVDCVSLELMSQEGWRHALTLDRHFTEAGFEVLPDPLRE